MLLLYYGDKGMEYNSHTDGQTCGKRWNMSPSIYSPLADAKTLLTFAHMTKIKHNFSGQNMAVLPAFKVEEMLLHPLCNGLVVRSAGFFPKAAHHYIDRPQGAREYILHYCMQGEGWYELDGVRHTVTAGDCFVLPPRSAHKYGASEDAPWSVYYVHFTGNQASYIYKELGASNHLHINNDEESRIRFRCNLFDEIIVSLLAQDTESLVYANLCCYHLMGTFLSLNAYRHAKVADKPSSQSPTINLATHYMNEQIDKQLSLQEIADYCHLSTTHFLRLFTKEMGISPIKYFQQEKIRHAAELLKNSSLKINQVAARFGFDDPYYFSKVFSKVMGMSPSEFRNKQTQI